jgi:hypothetical protein
VNECLVSAFLVKKLGLQQVNVLVHLGEQVALVLGDRTTNLGPHQQLVVVGEDLEHLICCHCLG